MSIRNRLVLLNLLCTFVGTLFLHVEKKNSDLAVNILWGLSFRHFDAVQGIRRYLLQDTYFGCGKNIEREAWLDASRQQGGGASCDLGHVFSGAKTLFHA